MAATIKDVTDLSLTAEFDNVAERHVTDALAEALLQIHAPTWGATADTAQALLAAHILVQAMRGDNAPAGPLVSESAGGLSHSFAAPPQGEAGDAYLNATRYGRRYLQLRRTLDLLPFPTFKTVPE